MRCKKNFYKVQKRRKYHRGKNLSVHRSHIANYYRILICLPYILIQTDQFIFRFEYQSNPTKEFIRTVDHELAFQIVTPKSKQEKNGRIKDQSRQPRLEYDNLSSSENRKNYRNQHLYAQTQEELAPYTDDRKFDTEYIKKYPYPHEYQEQDQYYQEGPIPDHIVFRR